MKKNSSFHETLDAVDALSVEEQETLIDILNHRLIEKRRSDILEDIKDAQKEFAEGKCSPITPDELMREIMK